jgi:hypothetical protein
MALLHGPHDCLRRTQACLREVARVYEPAVLPLLSVPFGASPAASTDVYFSRQSSSSVPCRQPLPLPLLHARSWLCHAFQSFRCAVLLSFLPSLSRHSSAAARQQRAA